MEDLNSERRNIERGEAEYNVRKDRWMKGSGEEREGRKQWKTDSG